jgi:hypothetical protein
MVQKLLKEIVLTMDYELNIIASLYQIKVEEKEGIKSIDSVDFKSLEEWKTQLQNISVIHEDKKSTFILSVK